MRVRYRNFPGRTKYKLPPEWTHHFPSGREIISFAACHYDRTTDDPDSQLTRRRKIEFEIFLAVEELHVLGQIAEGFATVNDFITLANSVSNRRKSRAGKSLELHLESLFKEHGATSFETQAITEGKKNPISSFLPVLPITILITQLNGYACWGLKPPVRTAGGRY